MGLRNKIMLHGWILFYNMQRFNRFHPTLDYKNKVTIACSPKHHTNAVIQYLIVLLQPIRSYLRGMFSLKMIIVTQTSHIKQPHWQQPPLIFCALKNLKCADLHSEFDPRRNYHHSLQKYKVLLHKKETSAICWLNAFWSTFCRSVLRNVS